MHSVILCGQSVHTTRYSVWASGGSSTQALVMLVRSVRNTIICTTLKPQYLLFSSAVFTHTIERVTSVLWQFLHIIHRAYKEYGNSKKGILSI